MKRHAKELVKELEGLGYEFDRLNSKAMHVYVRDGMPDLIVSPGCDENTARQMLRSVKRRLGCADEVAKRNPAQIKERQAAERDRAAAEVERLRVERQALLRERDGLLNGRALGLTEKQIAAIEARIEANEAEARRWQTLMTETPASANHRGTKTARHRSGAS